MFLKAALSALGRVLGSGAVKGIAGVAKQVAPAAASVGAAKVASQTPQYKPQTVQNLGPVRGAAVKQGINYATDFHPGIKIVQAPTNFKVDSMISREALTGNMKASYPMKDFARPVTPAVHYDPVTNLMGHFYNGEGPYNPGLHTSADDFNVPGLQRALHGAGYYPTGQTPSGKWDPYLEAAIKAFERKFNRQGSNSI